MIYFSVNDLANLPIILIPARFGQIFAKCPDLGHQDLGKRGQYMQLLRNDFTPFVTQREKLPLTLDASESIGEESALISIGASPILNTSLSDSQARKSDVDWSRDVQ